MKKIVYIKYSPLTKKVYEDCCMGALLNNGYEVEYWDVTKLFGFKLNSVESYNPQNALSVVKLNSYYEMDNLLLSNNDLLFIIMMTCSLRQAKVLRLLTKHHCLTAFWGPDPVFIPEKSFGTKFKGLTFKKVRIKLGVELMKVLFKTGILHYYDYYFNVGINGHRSIGVVDNALLKTTLPININSSDYNDYSYKNYNKEVDQNYVVFIDQYFPFHPDFVICGAQTVPAEPYYESLNKFFSVLESQLKMKVVVAAHPKSLLYKERNFFNGREIHFGRTCTLVKNASLVLAHDSTAIGYAVMSKKPIVLLALPSMEECLADHILFMKELSSRFSIPFVNVDEKCPQNNYLLSLTEKQLALYESYINEYCTLPKIAEPNESIVVNFVNKLVDSEKCHI